MQEKVLSISVASYNTEKIIKETISSLFTSKEYMDKVEIIIVNDGSKDATSEVAHDLEKIYPQSIIVIDKDNGGYGSTINASLSIAKGKYFKLLDGDDWYATDILMAFIDYLEKSEADLIISPYYEVKDKDYMIDTHMDIPNETVPFERINIVDKPFAMHEIAIRTNLLKEQGKQITEHCFYTDSEYVFYCLVAAETISKFNKPIYRYRLGVDGQSVSLSGMRKHYKDFSVVMNQIVKCHALNCKMFTGAKKQILDRCVLNIMYHAYRSYMLLNDPLHHKKELIKLDEELRNNYQNEYLIGNISKFVRLVRLTRFRPYKLLCAIARKLYNRETTI